MESLSVAVCIRLYACGFHLALQPFEGCLMAGVVVFLSRPDFGRLVVRRLVERIP